MSLTDLQAIYLPKRRKQNLQREFKVARLQAQRLVRAHIRKAKSRTNAVIRRQYFVTDAYTDLRLSAGRNEDIFLASLFLTAVVGYSAWATAMNSLFLFLETAYDIALLTDISMPILMLMVMGITAVLVGWLISLLLNMISLSLIDGASRKPNQTIRSTARRALRYTSRVTGAWMTLAFVFGLPLVLLAAGIFAYIKFNSVDMFGLLSLTPYAIIAALSWFIIMIVNYGLVPHVALFEPAMPLSKTFGRSRQLVQRRGRLFLLSNVILFAGACGLSYIAAAELQSLLSINRWFSFTVGVVGSIVVCNGLSAMLYRKRKLARVN